MSVAATTAGAGRRTVLIRGTAYPVLLPTLRDPRLHLAAVIISLQVLGQAAFRFDLSIAQILLSLGTCAILEFAIAFGRHHVIMWPASALLTGNGVAFVLRVPGTQHGDWWSLRGWWIYVATAAVALLSKHVIRFRGRHIFNPSNIGLVLCFLILGKGRADPLDFWWARMSIWLALALVIIVAGGLLILSRLKLLAIAIGFWLAFAAGIGVLALTDHAMTARWHLGPVTGAYFWWVLITSPEVLVFLFFMITDPKTIPEGRHAQRIYAVAVGLLAVLLIAPQTTEFASKVALLAALAIVCGVHPFLTAFGVRAWAAGRLRALSARRPVAIAAAVAGVAVAGASIAIAGIPARLGSTPVIQATDVGHLPAVTILPAKGVEGTLTQKTAVQIARSLVADLRTQADALRRRDATLATTAASGRWLAGLQQRLRDSAGKPIGVPTYQIEKLSIHLEARKGQGAPLAIADLEGTAQITTFDPSNFITGHAASRIRFHQTFELTSDRPGQYLISRSRSASSTELQTPTGVVASETTPPRVDAATARAMATGFASVKLQDVAKQVGLDFSQGSFQFGVTPDTQAMMGGGLCWLDYNNDGWLDLFVVNSYSDGNIRDWQQRGGLPRSALFRNDHGKFVNVSANSGAGIRLKGTGCVAADFNGDGFTDLYVTSAVDDQLLWNNGDGTFTEGARSSGVVSFGWHSSAAVADVNGDGRPDLFVGGYTEINGPVPGSAAGFPTNHLGVRDELFLNLGNGPNGHARFREVGRQLGIDTRVEHALGAVFTDVNGDGRPDLYVANDEDPNRLYINEPASGGLGFRLVERAQADGVADANAGMGIAAADYNGDGLPDLFVSNSRQQAHGIFRSRPVGAPGPAFADARSDFTAAFGTSFAGWGASWVDLNRDGNLDLVLANGDIPITKLATDARPVQVLENLTGQGRAEQFADAGRLPGLLGIAGLNGRGLAAADFDNDGNVDIAINQIGGPLVLLRNTNKAGHWLEVSLAGFHPNAVVTVVLADGRRLVREIQAGSSYESSEDPRAFFGLGAATVVKSLVVRLPNGHETRLANVAAHRILTVKP